MGLRLSPAMSPKFYPLKNYSLSYTTCSKRFHPLYLFSSAATSPKFGPLYVPYTGFYNTHCFYMSLIKKINYLCCEIKKILTIHFHFIYKLLIGHIIYQKNVLCIFLIIRTETKNHSCDLRIN